jgi:hypothetical protein
MSSSGQLSFRLATCLVKGPIKRSDIADVNPVPDPALPEVPISEKAEFQWRYRSLDRHVEDADDEAPAVEPSQRLRKAMAVSSV